MIVRAEPTELGGLVGEWFRDGEEQPEGLRDDSRLGVDIYEQVGILGGAPKFVWKSGKQSGDSHTKGYNIQALRAV